MDFPSNSHNSKEEQKPKREEKNIEKVITGEVIIRKKTVGRKFKDIFFSGDLRNVFRYIGSDVFLPALRNMLIDATTKGMERIVYGDSDYNRRRYSTDYTMRSRSNYIYDSSPLGGRYRDPRERGYRDLRNPTTMLPDQAPYSRGRIMTDIDEVILSSRQEAELVVDRLRDAIELYDSVSVADLRNMLGQPSVYTDNNWGWTRMSNVEIRQIREGWLLNLPSVEPI